MSSIPAIPPVHASVESPRFPRPVETQSQTRFGGDASITEDEVREALARMLQSTDFPATPRNRRFLEFVVLRALAGERERINAYSIGTQVLGRPETFDAVLDPIVRIEAGKLRRDIETYHLKSAKPGAVRIEIPKGRYCPVFVRQQTEPGPAPAAPEMSGNPTDDAKAELARVLASEDFPATPRNRRFLQYSAERALAWDGGAVTARDIAINVFGRKDDFDSLGDPIVRIEACKLRRDLETYYLKSGRHNPLHITLPKGGYTAVFRPNGHGDARG